MTESTSWQRIVIGLDGSDGSRRALKVAIALARPLGSEVLAVTAVDPIPAAYALDTVTPLPPPPEPDLDGAVKELDEEWCEPLRAAGIPYRPLAKLAKAATAMLDVAEEEHADLIVVGRRGLGSVTELLLGSVSHELSHASQVPVVIVPHPKDAHEHQREHHQKKDG